MSKNDPQLTPAASELLDEITEQLKARILRESQRNHSSDDPVPTVRMSNIKDAAEALNPVDPDNSGRRLRVLRITVAALTLSAVIVGGAAIAAAITGMNEEGVTPALVASFAVLAGALAGAFFSDFAARRRDRRAQKKANVSAASKRFVGELDELVQRSMAVGSKLLEADADTVSLSQVSYALQESNVWTSSDVQTFRRLLIMRNMIVHEDASNVEPANLTAAFSGIRPLREKISSWAAQNSSAGSTVSAMAFDYEHAVEESLRRLVGRDAVIKISDSVFDFLVELPSGSVQVAVKYSQHHRISSADVLKIVDRGGYKGSPGRLVITNVELSPEVRQINASQNLPAPIEVIQWVTGGDDGIMQRALARLAKVDEVRPTENSRFEIYRDSSGKYRFRFRSANGGILFRSELFDSRKDALASIDSLIRDARSAQVEDIAGG